MEDIVNLIMNNGLAAVLVAYFIFKDYKFNQSILDVLGEVKNVLVELRTWHTIEEESK